MVGRGVGHKETLLALLRPYPVEGMRAYSISTRVNSVKNDDAGLIELVMATGGVIV
jgi:putative SOS response-associated peptidase YedK